MVKPGTSVYFTSRTIERGGERNQYQGLLPTTYYREKVKRLEAEADTLCVTSTRFHSVFECCIS